MPDSQAAGEDPLGLLAALQRALPMERGQLYRELLAIFARLGDRHTHCSLPEPFASQVAFLPFLVGEFLEHGERHLAVLHSAIGELERGDVLVSWNGVVMAEVIGRQREWQHGSNLEARHAKAVQTLTFRPLALMPPPEEEGVILECVSAMGTRRTVRVEWRVAAEPGGIGACRSFWNGAPVRAGSGAGLRYAPRLLRGALYRFAGGTGRRAW